MQQTGEMGVGQRSCQSLFSKYCMQPGRCISMHTRLKTDNSSSDQAWTVWKYNSPFHLCFYATQQTCTTWCTDPAAPSACGTGTDITFYAW